MNKTLFIFVALVSLVSSVSAQTITPASAQSKQLSFYSATWQTMHLHDQAKAQENQTLLEQLGCEVTTADHQGHIDLRFRCQQWKTVDFETRAQVNTWANWMSERGLQTVIRNPGENAAMPTVSYRLTQPQSAHLHDTQQSKQIISIFEMLGCQVETSDHNGHTDINVQCQNWVTMGVGSEEIAHQWQAWLKSNGFETRHTHYHK